MDKRLRLSALAVMAGLSLGQAMVSSGQGVQAPFGACVQAVKRADSDLSSYDPTDFVVGEQSFVVKYAVKKQLGYIDSDGATSDNDYGVYGNGIVYAGGHYEVDGSHVAESYGDGPARVEDFMDVYGDKGVLGSFGFQAVVVSLALSSFGSVDCSNDFVDGDEINSRLLSSGLDCSYSVSDGRFDLVFTPEAFYNLSNTLDHGNGGTLQDQIGYALEYLARVVDGTYVDSFQSHQVTTLDCVVSFVDLAPLVDGGSAETNVSLDSPLTLETIKGLVSAKDLFGRDVGFTMSPVGNEYDPSALALGDYVYKLIATDDFGQTATATLTIHVVDVTAPEVRVSGPVSVGYKDPLTYDRLREVVSFTDKSLDAGGGDCSVSFSYGDQTVDAQTPLALTADMAKAGRISVLCKVVDSSGNVGTADIVVAVSDDVAPVISKKSGSVSDVVSIPLAMMEDCGSAERAFLSLYSAEDAVDGAVALSVDGFPASIDSVQVGSFQVTLRALDSAGNVASLPVQVEISSDASAKPYFVLDDLLLSATASEPLTADDVVEVADAYLANEGVSHGSIVVEDTTMADYQDNAEFDGEYRIAFSYKTFDGDTSSSVEKRAYVTVQNYGSEKPWYRIFADWFKYGWQCLVNWIEGDGWKTDSEVVVSGIESDNGVTADNA